MNLFLFLRTAAFKDRITMGVSLTKPVENCRRWSSRLTTPLSHCLANPVNFNNDIVSLVSGLGKPISPSAIIWTITPIVFYPVYAVISGWPGAHVLVELFEIINPFAAYSYASAAIIAIILAVFGVASFFHVLPRYMLRCAIHAMRCFSHRGHNTVQIVPSLFDCKKNSGGICAS